MGIANVRFAPTPWPTSRTGDLELREGPPRALDSDVSRARAKAGDRRVAVGGGSSCAPLADPRQDGALQLVETGGPERPACIAVQRRARRDAVARADARDDLALACRRATPRAAARPTAARSTTRSAAFDGHDPGLHVERRIDALLPRDRAQLRQRLARCGAPGSRRGRRRRPAGSRRACWRTAASERAVFSSRGSPLLNSSLRPSRSAASAAMSSGPKSTLAVTVSAGHTPARWDIVYSILIGIAAGFLAGQLTKGSGFGWIGNLLVGMRSARLLGHLRVPAPGA
jgi:hypothetical protein